MLVQLSELRKNFYLLHAYTFYFEFGVFKGLKGGSLLMAALLACLDIGEIVYQQILRYYFFFLGEIL